MSAIDCFAATGVPGGDIRKASNPDELPCRAFGTEQDAEANTWVMSANKQWNKCLF